MADDSGVGASVRSVATVLLAVALLAGAAGPAVGAGEPAGVGAADADPDRVEADRTVLSIDVAANGTATWSVEYFVALETTEDEQAWADLEADVEANTSDYRSRFADRIRSTVAIAENDTDRGMTADRFRVDTRTQPQFGVLVYRFRWTNFAAAEDGRLRIGDAIDGYLLDEDTRLVIRWPADYTAETVAPAADATRESAAVWRGSQSDFVAGEPRVVARAPGVTPTATTTGGTASATGSGDGGTTAAAGAGGGSDLPFAAAVGLFAVVVVAALVVYGHRQRGAPGDGATPGDDGGEAGAGGTANAGGDEGVRDAAGAGAAAAADDAEATPEELLSNEERVLKLVRDNGGRMKQQEVVDELDWTEAKTSQVVRGLRDDDELEGFRLGRENVLKLPADDDETNI